MHTESYQVSFQIHHNGPFHNVSVKWLNPMSELPLWKQHGYCQWLLCKQVKWDTWFHLSL